MKILSGRELVDFIKERQAHQVRHIMAVRRRAPRLVIFYDNDSPVIAKYMELKQRYGEDIGAEVVVESLAEGAVARAGADDLTDGIIIQLPLTGTSEAVLQEIPLAKDVDGLRGESDTATAMAIHWLLNGYNIELRGKKLAVVGQGRLVGAPLARMWRESGYEVTTFALDEEGRAPDLTQLAEYDVVVTATGVPALIKSEYLKPGAVVVDAGTASEGGVIVGDLDAAVRERDDLTLTPVVGGVGPLTVAMLFERLIQACEAGL